MTDMQTLKLGFAGAGWIGRNRLAAIAASGRAQVAAVFDPAVRSLDAIPGCSAATRVAESFEELLESDLDGIVVATPNALHAAQACAALVAGKAVFCQKPLARTAAETRLVVAAAREADRLLAVDLSYRFTCGMRRIRELIDSGELGRVYAAELVFHNAYGPDKPWFHDFQQAGGGCLLDLGIHLVDLAQWALGSPGFVSASGRLLRKGASWRSSANEVEDYASALLTLGGGASVQIACSWGAPAGCDARIEATFYGTRGGAQFRNVGGSFYDFIAEHLLPDRSRRMLAEPPDDWGGRCAVDWANRLATGASFDPQVETLVEVAEVLDQLYGRR